MKWWSSLMIFIFWVDSAIPPIRMNNKSFKGDPMTKAEIMSTSFLRNYRWKALILTST